MASQFLMDYPALRPAFWAQNGHIQTIASFLISGHQSVRKPVRHQVTLADGDQIAIYDDPAKSWITGDRIAILVHGLCGCHGSPYVRRIALRLRQSGIRTVRVDMRGFGGSALISRGHLHAGRSGDLLDVADFVNRLSPLSKISLIGFSLGANIVLKLLAELKEGNSANIDSGIAVAAPIDLSYCSANLRKFGNRIYDYYFMRRLSSSLRYRRRKVANLVDNGLKRIPDRLVFFDDEFTAPVNGFQGAENYYQQCSSAPLLKAIEIPTILVAAEDDPVIPFDMFDRRLFSRQIEFVHTKQGGHLGFLGRSRSDPDRHWIDWRICRWLSQFAAPQAAD